MEKDWQNNILCFCVQLLNRILLIASAILSSYTVPLSPQIIFLKQTNVLSWDSVYGERAIKNHTDTLENNAKLSKLQCPGFFLEFGVSQTVFVQVFLHDSLHQDVTFPARDLKTYNRTVVQSRRTAYSCI